jgi:cobyrinic acid a,c-diamide synthase
LPSGAEHGASPAPVADVRIGIARDRAFGFYYPDDLDALQLAGATLVPIDTLHDHGLPVLDGLVIGGGFPETCMEALEANARSAARSRPACRPTPSAVG